MSNKRVTIEVSYVVTDETDETQLAVELARFVQAVSSDWVKAEGIIVNQQKPRRG